MPRFPKIDLNELAAEADVDLEPALDALRAIYADVDERNEQLTAGLELPCHRGCSACCETMVFLSPIEFFGLWDYAQKNLSDEVRDRAIERGLAIYAEKKAIFDALGRPPPDGEPDHTSLVRDVAFRCPLLDDEGTCRIYPMREIYGRLFGCSFNDERGVYGCELSGEALGGKTLTLLNARPTAERILDLPLSRLQQVIPWYLNWIYGDQPPEAASQSAPDGV